MKDKTLNIIISVLIIAILSLVGYFLYANYSKDDTVIENNKITYKIEDYITIEKENVEGKNDKFNIEKITFKNLDASLVNDFINKQNKLINDTLNLYSHWDSFNFEGLTLKEGLIAYTDIWYQLNGTILTIYYNMNFEDAIGPCNEIIVLNIDLENKKIVTNEDLLKLGNSSFEKIADEHYNKTLANAKKCSDTDLYCGVQDKDYNIIKASQFEKDKDIYLNMIINGLDEAINCYIEDGKIKYDYKRYTIDILYMGVGKGGCFDYVTVELGDYK